MSAQIQMFPSPLRQYHLTVRASLKIGSNHTFQFRTGSPVPAVIFENAITINARSLEGAMEQLEEILHQCYSDILEDFLIYEDH